MMIGRMIIHPASKQRSCGAFGGAVRAWGQSRRSRRCSVARAFMLGRAAWSRRTMRIPHRLISAGVAGTIDVRGAAAREAG